jgi:hypothetical protein
MWQWLAAVAGSCGCGSGLGDSALIPIPFPMAQTIKSLTHFFNSKKKIQTRFIFIFSRSFLYVKNFVFTCKKLETL